MSIISKDGWEVSYVYLGYSPPYNKKVMLIYDIISHKNRTADFLLDVYDNALNTGTTEINFKSDGNQNNEVRKEILGLAQANNTNLSRKFAFELHNRLFTVTDKRNGKGLLIIMVGGKEKKKRIVLCRFKGDEGIYNAGKGKINVEYIEEIFTKRTTYFKLAIYQDVVSERSFWKGYAVDKQVTSNPKRSISQFWVEDFLNSEPSLTSFQGTSQFAKTINAILSKTTDIEEQEQIVSAIINLKGKKDEKISLSSFCENYLSESISERIRKEVSEDFFNSIFPLDVEVYKKEFGKTTLKLDNGIMAFIPTFNYNKYVDEKLNNDGTKQIVITGKLSNKKFNKETIDRKDKKANAK